MQLKRVLTTGGLIAVAAWATWWFWPRHQNKSTDLPSHSDASAGFGHSVLELPGQGKATHGMVDPSNDSWPTEVAHAAIKKQLKAIGELLRTSQREQLDSFASDSFTLTSGLGKANLEKCFDDGVLTVSRLNRNVDTSPTQSTLSGFIEEFAGQLPTIDHCAFKVVHIQSLQESTSTSVLVEMRLSDSSAGTIQINATWKCQWESNDHPKLLSVAAEDFERIESGRSQLFSDMTEAVLGKTPDFEQHILRGINHWCERMSSIDDMRIFGHHGIAVADVNGDGLEDLYVCDAGGLPNRLYVQNADGTVSDFSAQSKTDWLESTTSALLIDLDNDGDQDLVAATVAGIILAANDGRGVFQIRNAITGMPEAHTICAADYDNDRDLDIYVCNYGASGGPGSKRGYEATAPVPYNDANNGGPNALLQNNGNFQFRDVAKSVGLDQNNRRFSFAASWEDFDKDGDVDLYVANDFGRNNLYENVNGRFVDIAASAGVEDMAGGMSVAWGDINRDSNADIYVGNMFSAAGNRVTYQRKFTDRHAQQSQGIQRMARGNTLFMSNGNGSFNDISETSAVTMGRWAWSSRFADINNDGWEDIVVANGYFTNTDTKDL